MLVVIGFARAKATERQNASTVGTSLKTISARIRGSKSELEELGEDTEDLAEGFSKYADEIKQLTGFDIMVEGTTDTFKDLYDIFDGLSAKWDSLSDTVQARVAEILGGTRQLQVVSSIMANWSDAEDAYTDAVNSAGTAYRANATYMDSTSAKIAQLEASFEELGAVLFDADLSKQIVDIAKWLVELATRITSLIDKIGGLKTVAFALGTAVLPRVAVGFTNVFSSIDKLVDTVKTLPASLSAAKTAWSSFFSTYKTGAATVSAANAAIEASAGIVGLLAIAVTAAISVISGIVNSEKEAREEREAAAQSALDEAEDVGALRDEYEELNKKLEKTEEDLERLDEIKQILHEDYEIEIEDLDTLIDKYEAYAAAAKTAGKLAAENLETSLEDYAITSASMWGAGSANELDLMTSLADQWSISAPELNSLKTMGNALSFKGIKPVWDFNIGEGLDLDTYEGAYELLERYETLMKELKSQGADEGTYYDSVVKSWEAVSAAVEEYTDIIGDANKEVAEFGILEASKKYTDMGFSLPKSEAEFDSFKKEVLSSVVANDSFVGSEEDAVEIVDELLSKDASFSKFYEDASDGADDAAASNTALAKSFKEVMTSVTSLSDGLDMLSDIYEDVSDGEDFDWSSIFDNEDFEEKFGGLGDAYNEFIETIANSSGDVEQCQDAFNNLTSAYIEQSGALEDVTFETKNAAIAFLEQSGVANAAELVEAKLVRKNAELSTILSNVTEATKDETIALLEQNGITSAAALVDAQLVMNKYELEYATRLATNSAWDNINAMINEASASEYSAAALLNLLNAQIANGSIVLDESSNISQIIALANAANAGAEYMSSFAEAQSLLAEADVYYQKSQTTTGLASKYVFKNYGDSLKQKAQWLMKTAASSAISSKLNASDFTTTSYTPSTTSSTTTDSPTSSSNPTSTTTEEEETWFEKQYKTYQHYVKMGKMTQAEFLKWLDEAYKEAYKEGIIDLDEYRQYAEDVYDGMQEIIENAKSAYEELIEYRVDMLKQDIENHKDALEEQLDELKEFYDKQKDMLQEQKDEEDYIEEQSEKRKSVSDIQTQLEMLANDNSASAQKKRLELQSELEDAQKELSDFESDHAYDLAESMLEDEYDKQEKIINSAIDTLDEKLNDPYALRNQAINDIKTADENLYKAFLVFNRKYGDGDDDTIKEMWESIFGSLDEYEKVFGKKYKDVEIQNVTGYSVGTKTSETSSTSTSTTTSTASSAPSLSQGSYVSVKPGSKWYYTSYGDSPWGYASAGTILYTNPGSSHPYNIDGLGWVRKEDIVGYKSGTKNATAGMHELFEDGSEALFTSSSGGTYKLMSAGDKVLNAKATDFLYDFANGGASQFESSIRSAVGEAMSDTFQSVGLVNNFTTGDIIINGNATEQTVSEIRRAQRDAVDYMLKSFQKLQKK